MLRSPVPDASATHESLFSALIQTAVDGIVVIDEKGIVQVFNSACEKLFGYAPQDVIGRNVKMLMPSPYREQHDKYVECYLRTGEKRVIGIGREVFGQRKDGSTFPMYLSVGEGEANGVRFFVGIIHDLTAMRAEEERRQASDRHLADIVESSEDIILSKALDGRILSWNAAAERIFGYTAEEMIGQSIYPIIPPERRAEYDEIMRRVHSGEKIHRFETTRRRKDGREIVVSLSISPLRDAGGKVVGASKIARDVTEERRARAEAQKLQVELAHMSRIEAMGQLSSALAHELNQPLAATMNYVNAARRWLKSGEGEQMVPPLLESAVEQIERAGKIIHRLRRFLEKRGPNQAPDDLNEIVREAVALGFAGGADSGYSLKLELAPGLPPVFADRVQIEQVIVNLLRNATEAMRDEKTRKLFVSTRLTDSGQLEIAVADTGPGIPPEIEAHLFEPFVSTKDKGMGVGLSISRTILEAHGGRIWMEHNSDGGATFRVCLPAGEVA